ncbi:hypothetical protein GOV10_05235 [Candidatus Woesearchaeota archaeon]|nr:hypothetical protein [Candidatus Woesearchaeota archaeon]
MKKWDVFVDRRGNSFRRTKNSYTWEERAVEEERLFHVLADINDVVVLASGKKTIKIPVKSIPVANYYVTLVKQKGEALLFQKAIDKAWVIQEPVETRHKLGCDLKKTG